MGTGLPIFVHVHIPKTAGTSLNNLLRQWFQDGHGEFYEPDPRHCYTEQEVDAIVSRNPKLVSISSHSIRTFPPLLGGRRALYYCFLRHPIERRISNFTYAKKNLHTFPEEHRRLWPENIETMTFRDLIVFREQEKRTSTRLNDPNRLRSSPLNRFFCERLFFNRRAFLQAGTVERYADADAHFQAVCVAMTTSILDSFAFVGLSERFNESVEVLRNLFNLVGLPAAPVPVPRANVSSELREDLSWINDKDEMGRIVLETVTQDMQVYEYGKMLFQKRMEEMASARSSQPAVDGQRVS